MLRRRLLRCFCLACLVAATGGGAVARADLLDPSRVTISSPGVYGGPQVAITPSGWTLVVWAGASDEVRGAWRPPGGTFGHEITLAPGHIDPHGLVATSDDAVAMVWTTAGRQNDGVAHAMVLDAGAASGPQEIVAGPGISPTTWAVADARGHAAVVVPTGNGLLVATRSAGEPFEPPLRLDPDPAGYPVPASNAAGDLAIAYMGAAEERLVERAAGATQFGAPEAVPVPPTPSPSVAVTDAGDVAIAGAGSGQPVFGPASTGTVLAIRTRGGRFTTQPLNADGFTGVLLPAPGNRLTVFDGVRGATGDVTLRYRDRTPAGAFTEPVPITSGPQCASSAVVTPAEDTVLATTGACGAPIAGGVVELSERPAGGVFSPVLPISAPGANLPDITVNPSGGLAVAWSLRSAGDNQHDVIQAAVRDGSAELGLVGGVPGVVSTVTGTVGVTLGCTGLHDCRGTVEVRPVGSTVRGVAARSRATRVVLLRGRTRRLRLAVPRAVRGGRARLVVHMSRVRRAAATRSVPITLRRRG